MACRAKVHADMTRGSNTCNCDTTAFTEIMSFFIENISPKLTSLKDTSTNYHILTRDPDLNEELQFLQRESCSIRRGENKDQAKGSSKKRKLAVEPTSPSSKLNNIFNASTPETVRLPANIGSMVKPYRKCDPSNPICNLKNLPEGYLEEYVVLHGYLHNMQSK